MKMPTRLERIKHKLGLDVVEKTEMHTFTDWKDAVKNYLLVFLVGDKEYENSYNRRVEFLAQRVKRISTWDDSDLWDLSDSLGRVIHERLLVFSEYRYPTPFGFEEEEWREMVEDMIYAFWWFGYGELSDYECDSDRVAKGLKDFGEHFGSLWM